MCCALWHEPSHPNTGNPLFPTEWKKRIFGRGPEIPAVAGNHFPSTPCKNSRHTDTSGQNRTRSNWNWEIVLQGGGVAVFRNSLLQCQADAAMSARGMAERSSAKRYLVLKFCSHRMNAVKGCIQIPADDFFDCCNDANFVHGNAPFKRNKKRPGLRSIRWPRVGGCKTGQ